MRPTWVEIDLDALDANVSLIESLLPEGSRLIPVLKANAYGHGAVPLARRLANRVSMMATVMMEEAFELRDAGIATPLLVLGPTTVNQIDAASRANIAVGIPGPEILAGAITVARDRDVHIHLKLDSGMGRMGIVESELADVVEMIRSTPRLRLDAIYTHLANAGDENDDFTSDQLARFETLLATLREAGLEAPLHHSANSAATVRRRVRPGDAVRVGLALYGGEPLDHGDSHLRPLMRWRTEIMRIKELPADHPIGYGLTYRTTGPSRIATIPVGYADGFNRLQSNRGDVLVRGRRVPIVGRVSMDLVTLDVTAVEEAAVGDEVVLLGKQGLEEISAEEIAERINTISYEVFCTVSARVPRVYQSGGAATAVWSRFGDRG